MSVRAKFKCVDKPVDHGLTTIVLEPVINGSAENAAFYKYTPSGMIRLGTVNEAAAAQFAVGQEYYVDFTPAEEAAPATTPTAPDSEA